MNASSHRLRKTAEKTTALQIACAYALLFALAAAILFLFAATAVSYAQADPGGAAAPAALCALYLSAVVCGIVAARKSEKPLLAGVIAGGIYLGLITLISFLPLGEVRCNFSVWEAILTHLGIPAAAMLGAFLGKKRVKRPTARKRGNHRR